MTLPAPIPALPDSERRTAYSITAQTGPFAVNFAIYGDGTDYAEWVEVWLNSVQLIAAQFTLTSPSGSIATLPRPITDAVITLTTASTGNLQIVGARRPRRTSQLAENQGVTARAFNQVLTDDIAQSREMWDRMRSRMFAFPAGETASQLPPAAQRVNMLFGFDASGQVKMLATAPTGVIPPGSISDPGSVAFFPESESPELFTFFTGSVGTPQTSAEPTVGISRVEAIHAETTGGQNAGLYVSNKGTNVSDNSINSQVNGVTSKATQLGSGDVCAGYFVGTQSGTAFRGLPGVAYGVFADAETTVSGGSAIALETITINSGGPDHNQGSFGPHSIGANLQAFGAFRCGMAVTIGGVAGGTWDCGLYITGIRTSHIFSATDSVDIIRVQASHTNGFDLTNATISGNTIAGPGNKFFVTGVGNLFAETLASAPPVIVGAASYSILSSDSSIIANNAGTVTLTFPSAASYPGRWIHIKTVLAQAVVSASSNVQPILGGAAGTAILAASAGKWAQLQSNGTNWEIMSSN